MLTEDMLVYCSLLQEIYARENELLEQVDKLVKEANNTLDGQHQQLANLRTQFIAKVGKS